jgi:thymidylate kinase
MKKISIAGTHGTNNNVVFEKILSKMKNQNVAFIPEQYCYTVRTIGLEKYKGQTDNLTISAYARQLHLETLYAQERKSILCDRTVLDSFVYYKHFKIEEKFGLNDYLQKAMEQAILYTKQTYYKIYLVVPSKEEIEANGFRLTDKIEQFKVHKIFLEFFKDFSNIEIISQEKVHTEEFVEKVCNEFIL